MRRCIIIHKKEKIAITQFNSGFRMDNEGKLFLLNESGTVIDIHGYQHVVYYASGQYKP